MLARYYRALNRGFILKPGNDGMITVNHLCPSRITGLDNELLKAIGAEKFELARLLGQGINDEATALMHLEAINRALAADYPAGAINWARHSGQAITRELSRVEDSVNAAFKLQNWKALSKAVSAYRETLTKLFSEYREALQNDPMLLYGDYVSNDYKAAMRRSSAV